MFDGFGIEPPQMSCLSRPIKGQLLPAKLPPVGNMHLRREIHSFWSNALHFSASLSLWNVDCWVMIKRGQNRKCGGVILRCTDENYWEAMQLNTGILLVYVLDFTDVLLSNNFFNIGTSAWMDVVNCPRWGLITPTMKYYILVVIAFYSLSRFKLPIQSNHIFSKHIWGISFLLAVIFRNMS